MRRILRDTDFILAGFVFCASLIVAVYAYAAIQEVERPSGALISGLKTGVHSFKIVSGQQCPGEIDVTLVHEAVWGLKSHGHLRASYGKTVTDVQLDAMAYFNPLGQLNNAHIEIHAEDFMVAATLSNPHPITVDISSSGNGPQYHQHFTIPGPLTIQRNSDASYRIDYADFVLTQNPSVKALEGLVSRELKMSVTEALNAPPDCNDQKDARLDLLPLVVRSGALVGPLLAVVGGGQFEGQ